MTGTRIEGQTAAVLCRVAIPIAVAVTVLAGAAQARADSSPGGGGVAPAPHGSFPGSSSVPAPDPTQASSGGGTSTAGAPSPTLTKTYTGPHTVLRNLDSRDAEGTGGNSAGPTATTQSSNGSSAAPAASKKCPPPPPQLNDKKDHGFFTIKVESKAHSQFLLTLTFRCYDKDEPQHLTLSFTGISPGAGKPVKVLSGDTTPTFTGKEDAAQVDFVQSYLVDPTVLGAPVTNDLVTNGWAIKIVADVKPDNSASRAAAPVALGGPGKKPPSVLPFHQRIPHSTLPQTGIDVIKIYGVGIVAVSIGLYLWYVGALPVRRPKHRA